MKNKDVPSRKITRPGFKHKDTSGRIVEDILEYNDPDHEKDVYAFGSPITAGVARQLIQNYWDGLSKERDQDKGIAFTFGKEALLAILSQQDCEAIRFYFAIRKKEDFDTSIDSSRIKEGLTLVAIGADSQNNDIGVNDNFIVKPLEPGQKLRNIKQIKDIEDGQIREMVPPITLGQFINDDSHPLIASLAEVIKKYFKSK